jgi:hypothetical protein
MASEYAIPRQRLAMAQRWLTDPDREFSSVGKGQVRPRSWPVSRSDLTYKRKARLLRKLLARTRAGQVLPALTAWRSQLGESLTNHQTGG